jgi:hypothetical protein
MRYRQGNAKKAKTPIKQCIHQFAHLLRELRVRDGPLEVLDLQVRQFHLLLRLHHLALQLPEGLLQLEVGGAGRLLLQRHLGKRGSEGNASSQLGS